MANARFLDLVPRWGPIPGSRPQRKWQSRQVPGMTHASKMGWEVKKGGGIPRSEDEKPWKQSQAGPSLPNVVFYYCFSVIPPYCTSNYPTMGETWPSSLSEEQGPDGAMAFNINISSNCSLTPLKYTDKEGICLYGFSIHFTWIDGPLWLSESSRKLKTMS